MISLSSCLKYTKRSYSNRFTLAHYLSTKSSSIPYIDHENTIIQKSKNPKNKMPLEE